ncbi:MAG: TadE/TadG family type IV pilus assembly protein [Bryobacteraceae bacterium]
MREFLEREPDNRRVPRRPGGALVVHYWTGGAPAPRKVANVSTQGAYIQAPDTWYPGTIITLTFQVAQSRAVMVSNGGASLGGGVEPRAVRAVVIRSDSGGFGVQFLFTDRHERIGFESFLRDMLAGEPPASAQVLSAQSGQALIEFALLLPLLFLLIMNVVNFGSFIFSWIAVANAARAGADYLIMGAATINGPANPTPTQVQNIITKDISSLLNRSSLQVRVCKNNQGTSSCVGTAPAGDPQTPPTDPESPSYISTTIDVTYTFVPPIPGWSFPNLSIYLTLPQTTIHRRAVMRMMQ